MINHKIKTNYLVFATISILVMIIYGQIFNRSDLIYTDDTMIIWPIQNSPGFYHYLERLFSFRTVDFQPIRDLSFWFDIKFLNASANTERFIQMNIFYWILICYFSYVYFSLIFKNSQKAFFLAIIIAVYPLFTWSVSIVAVRKHILACLFSILYLIETESEVKSKISIIKKVLFYLLSCFSNPIAVFLPLGVEAYSFYINRKLKPLIIWLLIVLAAFLPHYLYYQRIYRLMNYETLTQSTLGLGVLALGRYWYQIIFPSQLALYYDPSSLLGLIGLILFVATFWIFYKKLGTQKTVWAILMIGSILLIPVARVSQNFVCDHYLLIPGIIYLSLAYEVFTGLITQGKYDKFKYIALLILLLTCVTKSFHEVSYLKNAFTFFKISFEREAIAKNTQGYFNELLILNREDEITRSIPAFLEVSENLNLPMMTILIYYSDKYSSEEKIKLLEDKATYFSVTVAELIRKETNQPHHFEQRLEHILKFSKDFSPFVITFLKNKSRNQQSL